MHSTELKSTRKLIEKSAEEIADNVFSTGRKRMNIVKMIIHFFTF